MRCSFHKVVNLLKTLNNLPKGELNYFVGE